MKTRQGFVSNSSSSSFIVVIPYMPKDEHDIEGIFFPEGLTNEALEGIKDTYHGRKESTPANVTELSKEFLQVINTYGDLRDKNNLRNYLDENMRDLEDLSGMLEFDIEDAPLQDKLDYTFEELEPDDQTKVIDFLHPIFISKMEDGESIVGLYFGSGGNGLSDAFFQGINIRRACPHLKFIQTMDS